MKAVRAVLILSLLSCSAFATTGGSEYAGGFCLEPGGKRILYARGDNSEAGNGDWVIAIDLATGKESELVSGADFDTSIVQSEKVREGCTPLLPATLEEVGLKARSITPPGGDTQKLDGAQLPDDTWLFRPVHPQVLELQAGGKTVLSLPYSICYGVAGQPVNATAYVMPGKSFAAIAFTYTGICYEGGYLAAKVLFLPSIGRVKKLPPRAEDEKVSSSIPTQPPKLKTDRLYNDAGMAAYRAGRFEVASRYFRDAFELSKAVKAPYLLAEFNAAAALARAGKIDDAVEAMAIVLSYRAEREKYRAKIRKDPDFKPLLEDPRVKALLEGDDCCAGSSQESGDAKHRSRTEWRWVEGESVLAHEITWDDGVKTSERTPDAYRRWNARGIMVEETLYLPMKRAISRRYREDGSFDYETYYEDGKIVKGWSDGGQ